ncbi:MAG TPA: DUF1853 family protein [Pseudomonas sabulinigri]|uniref:DUF1853 domain-containing protein n=1 Tax=marine sediment metagenome TaxID=412755 RepID=A0A0F9VVW5_9ZZZZ|nr:DUF1853 family protein [Halopseudomonas sabulinigri]HEC50910.1 DUF1853 family protein [Halopseudomonas sabulinigri]
MLPDFTHHIVRDLAWVAFAPPLLDGSTLPSRDPLKDSIWRTEPEQLLHRLQQLDAKPEQLQELFPNSRDRRLGNYYERLWHALLKLSPDVAIVAHNIALREAGRTLGELDLVIRAANGEITHLELAIKFYMGRPELQQPGCSGECSKASLWWGPDPSDQLSLKVQRLIQHQLPLVKQLEALQPAQYPQELPKPTCSATWLQGFLFQSAAQNMPPACGQTTRRGAQLWCHRKEVVALLPSNSRWIAIPHKEWLMPPKLPAASELLKPEQMEQVFANARAQQAVMFARVAAPDNYQPLHADRLICVADDWPA